MNEEKIYRIPKNLNQEFQLLKYFSMQDTIILTLLLCGGISAAALLQIYQALVVPAVFGVARCKVDGQTIAGRAKTALVFLLADSFHTNDYVLFERWRGEWK